MSEHPSQTILWISAAFYLLAARPVSRYIVSVLPIVQCIMQCFFWLFVSLAITEIYTYCRQITQSLVYR